MRTIRDLRWKRASGIVNVQFELVIIELPRSCHVGDLKRVILKAQPLVNLLTVLATLLAAEKNAARGRVVEVGHRPKRVDVGCNECFIERKVDKTMTRFIASSEAFQAIVEVERERARAAVFGK